MLLPPIAQDPAYHDFSDHRGLLGIHNFLNVTTNLAFLAVGTAGIVLCARRHECIGARWAWLACFIGVALVCFGSGYYHMNPNNDTLVWDRLPMSIGFMALSVAVLAENVSPRLEKYLLAPAMILGVASVLYWHYTDDLRPYVLAQFLPLLLVPAILLLFKSPYTHRALLLVALAIYGASKLAEYFDTALFAATGDIISGHSLKHLLAALSLLVIYWMLRRRTPSARLTDFTVKPSA
ncbi:MAG TPA: ceramidase domain-containing protein [Candidatus Methylomirabilis sp.]|nr:ceramidase domain-containing protein [Candidatus Methylomirabilis sp.]